MKTSLDHLPESKQRYLRRVTDMIVETAPVEMVILFGSYARGDWVEDRHFEEGRLTEYRSDYDILAVTRLKKTAEDLALWEKVDDELYHKHREVNVIAHSIGEVNTRIGERSSFFVDILNEGVMLYDSGAYRLARPKPATPEERYVAAREGFEELYQTAQGFFRQHEHALHDGNIKIAAFDLHQATEHAYHAVLMTFLDYKPKLHDIEKLGRWTLEFHPDFYSAFPRGSREQKYRFNLLKRAYVDARYKKNYKITPEELDYLASCVRNLHERVKKHCEDKIAAFGQVTRTPPSEE